MTKALSDAGTGGSAEAEYIFRDPSRGTVTVPMKTAFEELRWVRSQLIEKGFEVMRQQEERFVQYLGCGAKDGNE